LDPTKRPTPGSTRQRLAVGLLLVLAVALVYHPLRDHQFLILDDSTYVTENPYMQSGMTSESVRWALTQPFFTMRIPVTLFSYLAVVELFGTDPGPTLLANAAIHALGVLLLFAALARMTGCVGRSAFVAGVFALHPLHVESVAWASERKDVLCGAFWMLTLWAHARYAERPSLARITPVWLSGALAMGSKPMAVTLPFALLLVDWWPLGRLTSEPGVRSQVLGRRILEKLPLFLLAAAITAWTLDTHPSVGLLGRAQSIPAALRLENALVSYARYLGAAFWPANLGIFYPYPSAYPLWQPCAAGALLAAVSALALSGARSRGSLFVGWFWFVGTLLPVIGLIQAGSQAMADRYTYIPLVGISLAVSWGIGGLPFVAARERVAGALAIAVLIALGCASSLQLRHWQDGVTLLEHTLAVTEENGTMRGLLGLELLGQGRVDEGVTALAGSLGLALPTDQIRTAISRNMTAAGDGRHERGDLMTAVVYYRAALAIEPDSATLHVKLGRTLLRQTRFDEAIAELRTATALDPNDAEAQFSLGLAYELSGQPSRAAGHYRKTLRLAPGSSVVRERLGRLRVRPGAGS